MDFIESNLLIPLKEIQNISLIPSVEETQEHFTEEDYKKINKNIKNLKNFNNKIISKIKEKEETLQNIETNKDVYSTFIHMFDNVQQRNESYYKTLLLLITLIFILILCIISYYIYYKRNYSF